MQRSALTRRSRVTPPNAHSRRSAVAERARHDQVGLDVLGDRSQMRGLRSLQRRRDAGRLDAVAMKPVADVGDTASRRFDFVFMDEFDDVDPFAGLQDRQGVRDRAARLARILPANKSPRQFEPGRAGRRHENGAPGAHDADR